MSGNGLPKQTIAVLAFHSEYEAALRTALSSHYKLHIRRSRELLLDALRHGVGDLAIVELDESGDPRIVQLVEEIRGSYPTLPILGYVDIVRHPGMLRITMQAMQAGMTEVITHRLDNVVETVHSTVAPAPWQMFMAIFRSELDAVPSELVRRFCWYALENAAEPMTVERAAKALGTSERKVVGAFRDLRLRSPRWFLARVRMLAAIARLDGTPRRAEHVALAFGYPSGDTMRRALARQTGFRARDIRSGGAFELMAAVLQDELRSAVQHHATPRASAIC